jgi:phosphatidylserine/phosphatidylglycerophosphate/cardiolipin synthase-like enzyme
MSRRRRSNRDIKVSGPTAIVLLILLIALTFARTWLDEEFIGADPTRVSAPPAGAPAADTVFGDGSIAVYFSDPLSGRKSGGPEDYLIRAIDQAQRTIDMAIYSISLENVAEALLRAQERGVQVRLVMESEAMERKVPQRLQDAGIPILGDRREGLMHNKFTVIDGKEVWTGSLNLTSSGAYQDFNNLLVLRSPQIAENYAVEFAEMFDDDLFGSNTRAATPYPAVSLGGIQVETYFSPDDKVAAKVIRALSQARTSIDFMVYSFTSDPIADALLERGAAGVTVRGVFDQSQARENQGSEHVKLKEAGHDIRIDGISGLLHHKVFIIDGSVVITGSYNFSANAERKNDENLLIIYDPDLARLFLTEFDKVYYSAQE